MFRYRYINPTPVVFAAESWQPALGEEREFDHEVNHPFLQLVTPIEPPAAEAMAVETQSAVTGDETEGQ